MLVPDVREAKFASAIVNPNKAIRDRTLTEVVKYLSSTKSIDEFAMMKIWKALYYSFWLSDKMEVQLELAQTLSGITLQLQSNDLQLLFVRCFFRILMREWSMLDQYRVNKFYSLVRYFFRTILTLNMKTKWQHIETWMQLIDTEVLQLRPNGVRLHLADIVLDELATVTKGKLADTTFQLMLKVFLNTYTRSDDAAYTDRVGKSIVQAYIEQYSKESLTTDDYCKFKSVSTLKVQNIVFELASRPTTTELNRKKLYELHRMVAAATGVQFADVASDTTNTSEDAMDIVVATNSSVKSRGMKNSHPKTSTMSDAAVTTLASTSDASANEVEHIKKKAKKHDDKHSNKSNTSSANVDAITRANTASNATTSNNNNTSTSNAVESKSSKKSDKKRDSTNTAPTSTLTNNISTTTSSATTSTSSAKKSNKIDSKTVDKVTVTSSTKDTGSFIASKKFSGAKPGFVFRAGPEGLGYYVDRPPVSTYRAKHIASKSSSNNNNKSSSVKKRKF